MMLECEHVCDKTLIKTHHRYGDDLGNNPYIALLDIALLDIALTYVDEWENEHLQLEGTSTPRDVLEFLIQQHGATKKTSSMRASQPMVSKMLNGERVISEAVAKKLAAHFTVEVWMFV